MRINIMTARLPHGFAPTFFPVGIFPAFFRPTPDHTRAKGFTRSWSLEVGEISLSQMVLTCGRPGSGCLASTSSSSAVCGPIGLRTSSPLFAQAIPRRSNPVITAARKKDGPQGSGFNFERTAGAYRVSLNGNQLLIPEQTVMLSGLALLGLGAIIGNVTACMRLHACHFDLHQSCRHPLPPSWSQALLSSVSP